MYICLPHSRRRAGHVLDAQCVGVVSWSKDLSVFMRNVRHDMGLRCLFSCAMRHMTRGCAGAVWYHLRDC
jgi:hypothetical protein